MEEVREEIGLVANIIERLLETNEILRADQLAPLTKRLRNAADALCAADRTTANAALSASLPKAMRSADAATVVAKQAGGRRMKKAPALSDRAQTSTRQKASSQGQALTPSRNETEGQPLHVSSDVARSFCCSLYNILEGTVSLLRASHGHIFVKNGDYVASIANVSKKLVFPPQQVHFRCMGNADAEVLGSSIALNRFTEDVGKKSALLIYPIFGKDKFSSQSRIPVATIHVERKEHVFERFSHHDEYILYFASMFCGELMSRIPHFDWLDSFYDPATQHIVAPFAPYRHVALPRIRRLPSEAGSSAEAQSAAMEPLPHVVSHVAAKMEAQPKEVLIRRESLPSRTSKPFAPGVTHMPSLLEIQAYVDNLQSCWKKNMTANVDLLETDRSTHEDLKVVRSELISTRRQLAAANERLRLYELESRDYKYEYGALKTELDTYMDKMDRLR